MLLANLLSDNNFNARVQELALEFRKRISITFPVNQLGIVVPDVEAAAAPLEKQGVGSFLILSGAPVRWTERGVERRMRGKFGRGYFRGVELELLEPGQGTDFYRQYIDAEGRPVIQHVGFFTSKVDEWTDRMAGLGYPTWVKGKLKSGPVTIDFAYIDTVKEAGIILEFIGERFAGIPVRSPGWLLGGLGRIEKMIGKRCIDAG